MARSSSSIPGFGPWLTPDSTASGGSPKAPRTAVKNDQRRHRMHSQGAHTIQAAHRRLLGHTSPVLHSLRAPWFWTRSEKTATSSVSAWLDIGLGLVLLALGVQASFERSSSEKEAATRQSVERAAGGSLLALFVTGLVTQVIDMDALRIFGCPNDLTLAHSRESRADRAPSLWRARTRLDLFDGPGDQVIRKRPFDASRVVHDLNDPEVWGQRSQFAPGRVPLMRARYGPHRSPHAAVVMTPGASRAFPSRHLVQRPS